MSTYISEDDLTIKIGNKTIINGSKIVLNQKTKYGLVGPNGCGKSTLINWICQKLGSLSIQPYVITQHIEIDNEDQTVYDYMLRANPSIYSTNKKVEELESKEEMTDEELDQYNQLTSSFEYSEYSAYVSETKKILKGLGIVDYLKPIKFYSGGWRMRVTIARSLISKPPILIMDEPTNHLDLNAVIWLSNYLVSWKNTLLVVSHQIDFINTFVDVIWYIGSPDFGVPKLYIITGGYSNLQRTLSDISKAASNAYDKYESSLENFRKSKKGKQPPTKLMIEEFIEKNKVPRPPKDYQVKINFPEVNFSVNKSVITLEDVSFSYVKSQPLLSNINLSICLDSRYVIVGENGVGKTTIFKLCEGVIEPSEGTVTKDSRVRVGYYNQQVAESLPLDLTPIEYLQSLKPGLSIEKCRACLSKVGLRKIDSVDPCGIKIADLSGGQKARVSFCSLQIQEPNVILLDEPTNHLDIESIEGLIQGINDFQGAIIMITHDVYVISQISNIEILEVCGKSHSINKFRGEISDYVNKVIAEQDN